MSPVCYAILPLQVGAAGYTAPDGPALMAAAAGPEGADLLGVLTWQLERCKDANGHLAIEYLDDVATGLVMVGVLLELREAAQQGGWPMAAPVNGTTAGSGAKTDMGTTPITSDAPSSTSGSDISYQGHVTAEEAYSALLACLPPDAFTKALATAEALWTARGIDQQLLLLGWLARLCRR